MRGRLAWLFAIVALAWALTLLAAPRAASPGATWRLPAAVEATIYLTGSILCHQRPERSFHPWGIRMPVCARCTGLYAAAPAGAFAAVLLAAGARRRRVAPAILRWTLALSAVPTAVVWAVEWFALAHPSSAVRAVAALPLGAAIGWALATAIGGQLE